MAIDIEFLKSNLKMPARPTLFDVEISGPAVSKFDGGRFKFTCKAASLPQDTIGKIEVPFHGRKVPYAGDRNYADWNTTIIMDNSWDIYRKLVKWKASYNDPEMNVAMYNDMNAYKCDGFITSYMPNGNVALRLKIVGLFPYDIQQLELSWETTDTTADLNVTWMYDYWNVLD